MKVAIYGYGNLGRGVECAVSSECRYGIVRRFFSRRDPAQVHTLTGVKVYPAQDILLYKNEIDVLILCGGSATDLPGMTPRTGKRLQRCRQLRYPCRYSGSF